MPKSQARATASAPAKPSGKASTPGVVSLLTNSVRMVLQVRRAGREKSDVLKALGPGRQGGAAAAGAQARPQASRTGSPQPQEKRSGAQARSGIGADGPEDIPLEGWWQIAKRAAGKFGENELLSEAASVTFFALLALAPAITAVVSIYGLFADRSTIEGRLDAVSGFLPSGGMEIIRDQVHRLTQSPASGLSVGAVVGVLAALWSANQGSKAMFSALNAVYGERESRGFVRLTLTSLTFTLGAVVVMLAALGAIVVLPIVFRWIGLDGQLDLVMRIGRWPAVILVLMLALSTLYRFGPSRRPAQWRWVTWGGAIASIAWLALSLGFSWYVANFGNYNKTYGSLGAIVGFMTWIWLSSTVLLAGGQLNAEMEAQTGKDSTAGAGKPVGARGAKAADTVAAR